MPNLHNTFHTRKRERLEGALSFLYNFMSDLASEEPRSFFGLESMATTNLELMFMWERGQDVEIKKTSGLVFDVGDHKSQDVNDASRRCSQELKVASHSFS
jgi:hypothetical protein